MAYRKTVREIVAAGIGTVAELQEALLNAIQIEFATIPPYLCAQWSINNDPSGVNKMIKDIVVQEMLHFGFGCNMYTATGGSLKGKIAEPGFVPIYPGPLPAGVHPGLTVSLLPLGNTALQTFMSIEYPDVTPVVQQPPNPPPPNPPAPPTIGQFYQTIAAGFQTVFPSGNLPNNPSQNQLVTKVGNDQLFAINTVADALNAIAEVTDQGEGTDTSPDEGTFDPNELAHYYTFAQIYYGKTVTKVGNVYEYAGNPITMPTVFNFASNPNHPDQAAFISTFTQLMQQLEQCWTSGASFGLGTMYTLQSDGVQLIQHDSATPQFVFH